MHSNQQPQPSRKSDPVWHFWRYGIAPKHTGGIFAPDIWNFQRTNLPVALIKWDPEVPPMLGFLVKDFCGCGMSPTLLPSTQEFSLPIQPLGWRVCEVWAMTGQCKFGAKCTRLHPSRGALSVLFSGDNPRDKPTVQQMNVVGCCCLTNPETFFFAFKRLCGAREDAQK